MYTTTPRVFLICRPSVVESGMREWLDSLGATEYEWRRSSSEAESLIMALAKRCYMSFEPGLNPNVQKVRQDLKEYLTNILKQRHGSVLAHAHFSLAIENVSRVFTGEMNRHSIGMDISEGSMRFISFENLGLVETTAMREPKDDFDKEITKFLDSSFRIDEEQYRYLMNKMRSLGYDDLPMSRKKELTSRARRAIGMGISTGGVWTGNIRALRWICELRGTKYAEEEILFVAQLILQQMMIECPNLFGDFTADENGFYAPLYPKV